MRSGLLVAGVVALIAVVVALFVLSGNGTAPSPQAPDEEPAPTQPEASPDPLEPAAGTAVPPLPDEEAGGIRVHTNVPGAVVTLRILLAGGAPDPAPLEEIADADGLARFPKPDHPSVSEIEATARAEGHEPAEGTVHRDEVTLTLKPGYPVRGRVTDVQGTPIEDASVSIGERYGSAAADGTFCVWAQTSSEVEVKADHHAYLPSKVIAAAPSDNVVLALEEGLTITGRVAFTDGGPVVGARLQASRVHALAEADGEGRYKMSGLPEGEESVWCVASGERKKVEAGSTGVDFVVDSHVVVLLLKDEEGRPFKRAALYVKGTGGAREFTLAASGNESGVQRIDGIATGTKLQISPSGEGYAEEVTEYQVSGEPRMHEVEVVLRRPGPPGTLDLTATDDAGKPLPMALLTLENEAGSLVSGYYGKEIELGPDGRAKIEVPAGRMTVIVATAKKYFSTKGYGLPSTHEVVVESGRTIPVTAVVRTGGRVRVVVKDADGKPAALDRLRLLDLEGNRMDAGFLRVRPDGWTTSFDEPGPGLLAVPLPAGRYRVEVMKENETLAGTDVDVVAGQTTEWTITLPR